jgi:hypothetical protein
VQGEQVAKLLGAQVHVLEGVGHWWPLQAPKEGTEAISAFHASVR